MKTKRKTLAGLLLALILGLAGPVVGMSLSSQFLLIALSLAGMLTAGVVTYRYPTVVAGTTVAPSTAQVTDEVVADVAMADASTVTTITHNFGVETNGIQGRPRVGIVCTTAGTAPATPVIAFSSANAITLSNSTSAAGSGCTWRLSVIRPHTIGR